MNEKVYHERRGKVKAGNVLGVFAKRPRAGEVKSRLASATSGEWAARVAEAFLADTLSRLSAVAASRYLNFTPDDALAEMTARAGGAFIPEPQGEGDLGERLARFLRECPEGCFVVVVGSDSPTLPVAHVEQAFDELSHADVVLGP